MGNVSRDKRKLFFTFVAAGVVAVIGEHLIKPGMKRKLRV